MSHVRFDTDRPARRVIACRGVQEQWNLVGSRRKSILRCHTDDVRSLGADFIVCAGYKYLLSPWGTGFLWTKTQNLDSLRPG